jgi:amino acid transporter
MVIFNGIMWIIESSKWSEVKDAKKNITLIIMGIIISLMSLGIINLISSLTVSSLG